MAKNPTAIKERGDARLDTITLCRRRNPTNTNQTPYQLWNQGVMKSQIIQQLLYEGGNDNRVMKEEERDKHLK